MTTRALFLLFLLISLSISPSFSDNQKPLRITIHPTIINQNVVGSSTTIISSKTIKENSYMPLGKLLSKFSGINFENLYSDVDVKSSVRMRGFGEQATRNILVLVNGIRISDMTIAGANLSRIPLENIHKIEIIKGGSASVLFGDGAVGGAVNIITKDPSYLEDSFNVKTSFKSFNTKKQTISSTKKAKDFVVDFSLTDLSTDGYRDNSDYDYSSLSFDITNFKDDNSRLFAGFKFSDEQTRLPGSILLTDFYNKPKYTRFPSDFGNEKVMSFNFGTELKLNNNRKLSSNIKMDKKDQFSSLLSGGILYKSDTTLNTTHLNSKFNDKLQLLNYNITTKFGLDLFDSYYKVDANNWNYVQYINKANQTIIEPSLILNMEDKKINGLNYEIGFRSHHYSIDVDNLLSSRVNVLSNKEDKFAWSFGTDYNLKKDSKVFGHVSRSYRSPRLDEIISVGPSASVNDLKHQFSHDLEFGYEYNAINEAYKVSVFRSLIKNQIFYNPTTFANENYDPSIHEGVELEYGRDLTKQLKFTSNSTYMHSYVTKGTFKGNQTPYVPNWRANLSFLYDFNKKTTVSLAYKYFGKTRSGNDDSYILPKSKSYQLTDLNLSYNFKNFTLNTYVNNVLNEKYYTNLIKGAAGAYVYPQAGRTFGLELEAKF